MPSAGSIRFTALLTRAGFSSPEANTETDKLTPRELEVLQSLAKGNSYKMVADELSISIETVRTHIKRIYEKLHVHSVAEAIAKAYLK
jgi:DNA-binding NarL/FixJ family response regulator